ncbi:MAG: hypothetical protein HC860_14490 [Alkalinema sp. RU_4_3]|nr:hypothetical protein [Alkalinema sp. RU_4_3]
MIRSTFSIITFSLLLAQGAIAQTPQPSITDLAFPTQTGQTQPYSQPYSTNPSNLVYRVVIDSSDPLVLQQVRRTEPKAFFQMFSGNRVLIQTGAFATEYAARQQMALLARNGYQSILLGGPQQPGGGPVVTPPSAIGRGYYAIVPSQPETEREMLNKIISAGINGDQIQFRTQPFGRHYAIGPWSKRQGAEEMVKFLKERTNADARAYYQR